MQRLGFWITVLAAAGMGFFPAAGGTRAGDWPGWRGPRGIGLTEETHLPLTWGGTKQENLLWKVRLDGRGYSSPIVWGDRVLVTTSRKQSDQQIKQKAAPEHLVSCYQAATGKLLWSAPVPAGPFRTNDYAVPTPVTDGQRVYAWFGSGVLAALDLDGKLLWHKEYAGPFSLNPAMSSSPILFRDTVILLCEHNGEKDSFLEALDKETGAVKWEQKRPRAGHNNTTPILIQVKGQPQLVVASGHGLRGVNPVNGELIWSCADAGFVPSPVYGAGLVYLDQGADGPGLAVDPTGEGDVTKTHLKWRHPRVPWGYGSPLLVGDYLYRASKPGILQCWKAATGELVYSERLEGLPYLSSPFATAEGRLYFASPGKTYVLQAGPKLQVLAKNSLSGGDEGPSAAVAGGRIFLKSTSELFCIGEKKAPPGPD